MSVLILPRRFKSQPQHSLQPAPEYADAVILSPLRVDGRNIASSNHINPLAGVTTPVIRDHGKALHFPGTSYYRTDKTVDAVGKKFTIFAWVRPWAINSNWKRFLSTGYGGGIILGTVSGGGGEYMFTVNSSALDSNVGGQQVIGKRDFVLGTFDGSTAILYVNGKEVNRKSVTAVTTVQYLGVGADYDGSDQWVGDVDTVGFFYRAFSAGEVQDIYQNPARLFKAPARRLWAVTESGGATHDLTASNADQVNAASTGAITQSHALAGSASSQDNASSAAAITQSHVLTGANSSQSNTASTGAISQGSSLIGSASTQANTAATASITQTHVLVADSATQGNTASSGAISQGVVHDLAAAASTQANSGAASEITQAHVLVSAASVQDNIAAASAIVQAHILAGSVSAQANLASTGGILLGDVVISSIVERTAVFRSTISRQTAFQRSKTVTIRFN